MDPRDFARIGVMKTGKADLCGKRPDELRRIITDLGEPSYRADQIFSWIHDKKVSRFSRMTNLPKPLISRLENRFELCPLKELEVLSSGDGTTKYLYQLSDGHSIETVVIPSAKRRTLCLSSQVGCKIGCPFCVSGSKGFLRNLDTAEIVGQVLAVSRNGERDPSHVVFMGIGEPLDNFDHVTAAISIINSPEGINIGARHITISTCGLVPAIRRLKNLRLQVGLSISLHATTDELRNRLVPVNRRYPIKQLLQVCREYRQESGRIITLEYAVMNGINDSLEEARRLARMAGDLKAKVNLIPCNPNLSNEYFGAGGERLTRFHRALEDKGVRVTLRMTKGRDILAACGQLAFDRREPKQERKPPPGKGQESAG
jgi:23S rRNA (adenine2503-C2)-methyltransferase